MGQDERRREQRIPINDEFGRSAAGEHWVSDLSLGGVFVHTDELLPVGSVIELRFTILLDDPVVIEALGKVVRHSHKPRGMGVEFAGLQPDMQQRIETVLARHQPLDSGTPLRLPEPSREPKPPAGELTDGDGDPTNRVVFARPAPVEGLGVRRLQKQEMPARRSAAAFEEAVTASFPKLDSSSRAGRAKPRTPAREIADEARTKVYRAVRSEDE